jgi:protein SCO1
MARGLRAATVLVVVALVLPSGCSREPAVDAQRYQLTGVVTGREPSSSRVVVAHDPVSGFMPAMSMAFEVSGDASSLREGDRIVSTLVVTASRSWLEDVRITGRDGERATLSAHSRAFAGALVPGLELVDQHGDPITLRKFAARVLVVTFIYTRCPLPDFCPLMVRHLESVRRRANEENIGDRLALLGVTLDPAFDTPAVLRAYGEAMLEGENRFEQWTLATGNAAQIDDAARFFGVAYRSEQGLITHGLTTTVVGPDGRIMRTFESNSWRPDELFDVVRRGVERAAAE